MPAKPFDDELFQEAERKFQLGDWQGSKSILLTLQSESPRVKKVKDLLADIDLRISRDAEQQKVQQASQATSRIRSTTLVGGLIVLLVIGSIGSFFVLQQAGERQANGAATRSAELAAGYYDSASKMLGEDRPTDALLFIESLKGVATNYPGISTLESQALQQAQLATLYDLALDEIDRENYEGALAYLQSIHSADPEFRNVTDLIEQMERAITYAGYGPAGQYLLQAESILSGGLFVDTDLNLAQTYLDSASRVGGGSDPFKLRLQVLYEFLTALDEFKHGNPQGSVDNLEFIVANQPDLFNNVTSQMLEEAYLAQGSAAEADGHLQEALGSYLLAEEIALDSEKPLYTMLVKLKLASILGKLGQFQKSDEMYIDVEKTYRLGSKLSAFAARGDALVRAKAAWDIEDHRTAYLEYATALDGIIELLPRQEVTLTEGDSLLNVAIATACPMEILQRLNGLGSEEVFPSELQLKVPQLK